MHSTNRAGYVVLVLVAGYHLLGRFGHATSTRFLGSLTRKKGMSAPLSYRSFSAPLAEIDRGNPRTIPV
jgi:hypothetical protein